MTHKQTPLHATLKEAKAKCESYYDLYDQLRNCTCGECVIKDVNNLYKGFNRKKLSEHELELIREGRAMSDRDTRRGV